MYNCYFFPPNTSPSTSTRVPMIFGEVPQWLKFLRKSSFKAHLVLSRIASSLKDSEVGLSVFQSPQTFQFFLIISCWLKAGLAKSLISRSKFVQGIYDIVDCYDWLLKPFVRVLLSWIVVGRYFIKPLLKCTFARKKFKIRFYLKNLELKRYLSNLVFQISVKLHVTKQMPQFWHQSKTSFVHVFPQ